MISGVLVLFSPADGGPLVDHLEGNRPWVTEK